MTINNWWVALEVFFIPRKVGNRVASNVVSLAVLVNDWCQFGGRGEEEMVTGKGFRAWVL